MNFKQYIENTVKKFKFLPKEKQESLISEFDNLIENEKDEAVREVFEEVRSCFNEIRLQKTPSFH